jgi:phosphoserine phosphatase
MIDLLAAWSEHRADTELNTELIDTPKFVFDCDQTLINGDIGEATLQYAIDQRWVISHDAWWRHLFTSSFSSAEVNGWRKHYEQEVTRRVAVPSKVLSQELWQAYQQLCVEEIRSAYIFAARLAYGRSPVELALITDASLIHNMGVSERPQMKRFIKQLQGLGQVWVVSSSHCDIVRVIAHHYHIPSHQVIGIDFIRAPRQNFYTDQLVTPTPISSEKVDAYRQYQDGAPTLMVGDSRHDLPLMSYAQSALLIDHHQSDDLSRSAREIDALMVSVNDVSD